MNIYGQLGFYPITPLTTQTRSIFLPQAYLRFFSTHLNNAEYRNSYPRLPYHFHIKSLIYPICSKNFSATVVLIFQICDSY